MHLAREAALLFGLNLLDALLTIIWVRNGVANEGNSLMAGLLDMGDLPFLSAKIAIGIFAVVTFLRGRNSTFAKYGMSFVIAVYIGLMGIHFLTGLHAFGM
jgi:hypothetical protein